MFKFRNVLAFEQIDELSNYDGTCTMILLSSLLFYEIVIAPAKLMKVSYQNPLQLLGHDTPRQIAGCFLLFVILFQKYENM